jgi:hypothetical protein
LHSITSLCEQLEYSANLQKESKEVLLKISLHQKNKQISGGKRFVFTLGAVISAIWTVVKVGMAVYTVVDLTKTVVEEIVLPLLQDEKGLLIIKSRLLLSKYFIFQVWAKSSQKICLDNISETLCLGCNSWLCPASQFLITNPSFDYTQEKCLLEPTSVFSIFSSTNYPRNLFQQT